MVHLPGQRYTNGDKNQDKEIQRRITAGWIAFAKHRYHFKGNIGTCFKRQFYNSWVLPITAYGVVLWAVTTCKEQASSCTNKDRKEYVKHHIPGPKKNIWVREKSKVTHMIEQVRTWEWTWAGHISWIRDNRWTLRITTWKPYKRERPRGRPTRR